MPLQAASFCSRSLAFIIDIAILVTIHLGCFLVTGLSFLMSFGAHPLDHLAGLLVFCFLFLISPPLLAMIYFMLFHAISGQTIGKICMGIRVITQEGRPLAAGAAFLRLVGYIASSLPLATGFLWAAVDSQGLAWHDRLAGSIVVNWPETT